MSQMERIYTIHRLLQRGRPVSRRELEERFECSRNTILRDIQYMRDRLEAPLIHVRSPSPGYIYDPEKPAWELPGQWLGPGELQGLLVMQGWLESLNPSLLKTLMGPIHERFKDILKRFSDGADLARVVVQPLEARTPDADQFARVAEATLTRKALQITYHGRSRDAASTRVVDPQQIVFHRNSVYLLAWCHKAQGLRTFALDRIIDAELHGPVRCNLRPEELKTIVAESFGIFLESPQALARLRFSPKRARWVRDESWHTQQRGEELPDGGYLLEVPFGDPTELILAILRHGKEVEVLEPASLREAVAAELRAATELYKR